MFVVNTCPTWLARTKKKNKVTAAKKLRDEAAERRKKDSDQHKFENRFIIGDQALDEAFKMNSYPEAPAFSEPLGEDHIPEDVPSNKVKKIKFFKEKIPEIPVRVGYKTIDKRIMEILVLMEAKHQIPRNKTRQVLMDIANSDIFGQKWVIPSDEDVLDTVEGEESQYEKQGDESQEDEVQVKRRRGAAGYLINTLPSRASISKYVEDAAVLNFKYAAEYVMKTRSEGGVVTFGCDDTKKLAGNQTFDVKTGQITCKNIEEGKKTSKTFSLGFSENISHSGENSACTVNTWLRQMSSLVDLDSDELLGCIDLFITDRAGDSDKMLDQLGIAGSDRLKCNAHILLCISQALDTVFKNYETNMGLKNLISEGASFVFTNTANSIWFQGLNAFSKLLAPYHAAKPISLQKVYSNYLAIRNDKDKDNLLKGSFTKFQSNRFGRLTGLSITFTEHKETLDKFFSDVVEENR